MFFPVNSFCPDSRDKICLALIALFDEFLIDPKYSYTIQDTITFAAFWKDDLHFSDYLKFNNFLADVNNERTTKNPQYRTNMLSLNKFVCFYGLLDTVVVPNSSPIFSFFAPGNLSQVVPFEKSGQYTEDWLGLRTLQERGDLYLMSVNCTHTGAPSNQCKNDIWPKTIPFL